MRQIALGHYIVIQICLGPKVGSLGFVAYYKLLTIIVDSNDSNIL